MKKLLFLTILVLAINVPAALACGCAGDPDTPFPDQVNWAVKNSVAVFVGQVQGFKYRKGIIPQHREGSLLPEWDTKTVVFSINGWWKGDVGPETMLITDERRYADGSRGVSSCDYDFEEGKTYVVFAIKRGEYLNTDACSFTRQIDQAKEILELLGDSKPPVKNPRL